MVLTNLGLGLKLFFTIGEYTSFNTTFQFIILQGKRMDRYCVIMKAPSRKGLNVLHNPVPMAR